MAWACSGCGARYSIHLYGCPRCHGTNVEQEKSMPKITRGGGASHADDIPDAVEVPQPVEPKQLPAPADSEADTVTADEEPAEATASEAAPSDEDNAADADEPAAPARARTRRRTGATAGEGG